MKWVQWIVELVAVLLLAIMIQQQILTPLKPEFEAFYSTLAAEKRELITRFFYGTFIFGAALYGYALILVNRAIRIAIKAYVAYKTIKEMQSWMQSTATFSGSEQD